MNKQEFERALALAIDALPTEVRQAIHGKTMEVWQEGPYNKGGETVWHWEAALGVIALLPLIPFFEPVEGEDYLYYVEGRGFLVSRTRSYDYWSERVGDWQSASVVWGERIPLEDWHKLRVENPALLSRLFGDYLGMMRCPPSA